jgi:LacI family transcriptional regulator
MRKLFSVSSKDVAREAGVSQATVSYVLNDVPGIRIKPETKEAVLAAAKRLNYHPNLIARSMRLKQAMSIGVVSDKNVSNYLFMKALEGIKDALVPRNYSITLCFDKGTEVETAEAIRYYNSNRIDGIIYAFADIADEQIAYLIDHAIPFVVIHPHPATEPLNLIKTDLDQALVAAVQHLAGRGATRIAFCAEEGKEATDRRYRGFLRALAGLGLPHDPAADLRLPGGQIPAAEGFDAFFRRAGTRPQALITATTGLGFQLLQYAAAHRIAIPDDLAVIGIGTSRFAKLSHPTLSAIESPLYDMGFTGCELLFNVINGETARRAVVLEWTFEPRASG